MKVVKVIKNNLIRSFDNSNNEILVMACGLGFKKSHGDEVDKKSNNNVYIVLADHINFATEDKYNIELMLYVFADKFLYGNDLETVKEEMHD